MTSWLPRYPVSIGHLLSLLYNRNLCMCYGLSGSLHLYSYSARKICSVIPSDCNVAYSVILRLSPFSMSPFQRRHLYLRE